jgi:lipopolysaccharide export system protein LptA
VRPARLGAAVAAAALLVGAAAEAQPARKRNAPPRPAPPAAESRPDERRKPVTVDADQLESFQKEGLVIFTGNVVATHDGSTQWADRMEVYLDGAGEKVVRTVSTGNVRIVTRDCRMGTARRAEYYDVEQRVLLIGGARVWQDDNVVTGERITIYLNEERSVVEGGKQDRVKAVFYQKRDDQPKRPAGAPCP